MIGIVKLQNLIDGIHLTTQCMGKLEMVNYNYCLPVVPSA